MAPPHLPLMTLHHGRTRGQRDEVKQLRAAHLAERACWIAGVRHADVHDLEYVGWELIPPEWMANGMLQ